MRETLRQLNRSFPKSFLILCHTKPKGAFLKEQ